ncbi:heat shock 70 kDa protein 4-like [Octopus sinensis]|nr:heat shock 70 kDa protein 4-like [Octopus sinensis]
MSVVGIDFGSQSCYISVARAGGIETISNEYSDRCTPSYVSFNEKSRCMGNSSKNQSVSNFRNTLFNFRCLLGRKFNDPQAQEEIKHLPYTVRSDNKGNVLIEVSYMNDVYPFTPEQISAMLLTKLKKTAEVALSAKVVDCVVSVPCYFTDSERRALLDATGMCGLNCLRLLNDTTAASLAYGIYKQDLPDEKQKSRNVVFVNMGYSSLQVCVTAFNKGKLKVLAVAFDSHLGGRDFDQVLVEYFIEDFKQRYKLDVRSKVKPLIRLKSECEKMKKLMSATTQPVQLNIECFMEDKDVTGKLVREVFEDMCQPLFKRAEETMRSILPLSKLHLDDIHSVEVVGGVTRIPAIKSLIKKIFGVEPSTTLNADEVIARGCALQCAILSPTFRVRDFSIVDCQPYAVSMKWLGGGTSEDNVLEVFPKFHVFPFTKMMTFYRKESFQLEAFYSQQETISTCQPTIGSFKVQNVTPQATGESSKIKVHVKINIHGIFSVPSASMVEKLDSADSSGEPMDLDEKKEEEDDMEAQTNTSKNPEQTDSSESAMQTDDGGKQSGDKKEQTNKKVKKVKMIDLPVESIVPQLNKTQLHACVEKENQMIMQDKLEKDRVDAKNAVEEYVYEMRDRLYGAFEQFVEESHRSEFSKMLDDVENWLYDEGEDQLKQVYIDKLAHLQKYSNPICKRYQEAVERPAAFQSLGSVLQQIRKFLDLYAKKDEQYSHISDQDVNTVTKALKEKSEWFEKSQNQQNQRSLFEDPIVTCSEINSQQQSLESTCMPIINKPKPEPKKEPPPPESQEKNSVPNEPTTQQQSQTDPSSKPKPEESDPTMEVD